MERESTSYIGAGSSGECNLVASVSGHLSARRKHNAPGAGPRALEDLCMITTELTTNARLALVAGLFVGHEFACAFNGGAQ